MPDARRRVEEDDAVRRRQEGGLVDAVGDPVEVPLNAPDVVALLVESRAERGGWDGRVIRKDRGCMGLGSPRVHLVTSFGSAAIDTGLDRGGVRGRLVPPESIRVACAR